MALSKSLTFNTDLTSEYYQIENFLYDQRTKEFSVNLGFYSSQASREAGDEPLRKAQYIFTNVSVEDFADIDILGFLYSKVQTDAWAGIGATLDLADATSVDDVA